MAAKSDKQFSQLRLDLQQLQSGIQANAGAIGDIAAAEPQVAELLIALEQLNQEQERLKAQTEAATARLVEKINAAKVLRSSLRMQLKGRLGPKNEVLEAFGITVKS